MSTDEQRLLRQQLGVLADWPFLGALISVKQDEIVLLGASPSFKKALKAPGHQLEDSFWPYLVTEDRPLFKNLLQYAVLYEEEGESSHAVIRFKKKDGTPLTLSLEARAKKKAGGVSWVYLLASPSPKDNGTQTLPNGETLFAMECDLTKKTILSSQTKRPEFRFAPHNGSYALWAASFKKCPYLTKDAQKGLSAFLDPAFLKKEALEGTYNLAYSFSLKKRGTPLLFVEVTAALTEDHGIWKAALRFEEMSPSLLERKLLSQLTDYGYDIVGLLDPTNGQCRFYRLKKMGLGMIGTQASSYEGALKEELATLIAKEDVEPLREALALGTIAKKLEEWPTYEVPYSINSRDGKKKRKRFLFSYYDESHSLIFFVRSDLTASYLKEQEQIRRLEEAKLAAEKATESRSLFFSSLNHDIRAPLNGLLGFSRLALAEKDTAKKDEEITQAIEAGDLLLGLVNDSLDLSRLESGKAILMEEPTPLPAVFTPVYLSLEGTARYKKITLRKGPIPPLTVLLDRLKFEKVFLNLLSNALKYTPEGGTVTVTMEQEAKSFVLTVADTGIGIKKDFLPHLFEAFSQEKRPESENIVGTGLGLAIVKEYVAIMHGTVEVDSQVGRGTSFRVSLPLKVVDPTALPPKEKSLHGQGQRLLVAEDNYLNRAIAQALLNQLGFAVTITNDGQEALEAYLKSPSGTYAAVLLDTHMPRLSGPEAAQRIRAAKKKDAATIPLLAFTGLTEEETAKDYEGVSIQGYLTKPLDPTKLKDTLAQALK